MCSSCKSDYSIDEILWRCPCGGLLDLVECETIEPEVLPTRPPTLWRYREALPLKFDRHIVSLGEGLTPLIPLSVNGLKVLCKMDQLFPSGSYKDRGATLMISKVKELDISHVVEDSSGNAGAAIATYCAAAGIACDIYVPAKASQPKITQLYRLGATVHKIPGDREDTARAVLEAAEQSYYASHVWNPFFIAGCKTIAFEICEQLSWRVPDALVVPGGNGTLLLGAFWGFSELVKAGIIGRLPRLVAVQAENCSPCATAYAQGLSQPVAVDKKPTIAEGIAIGEPARGEQMLAAVSQSGGTFVTVGEMEIQSWLSRLHHQGIYLEPTSAAVFAGIAKSAGLFSKDELVTTVITGHGLKSTSYS